jgi:hypothetical protein
MAFRRQRFPAGPVSRGKDPDRRFEDHWREVVKVARSPEVKNGRTTAPPFTVWNRIWTYDSHPVGLAIRLQPCVGVHKRIPRKVWRPQPLWWVADCTNLCHRRHSTVFRYLSSVTDSHWSPSDRYANLPGSVNRSISNSEIAIPGRQIHKF